MKYVFFILIYSKCLITVGQKTANVSLSLSLPSVALIDIQPSASPNFPLKMTAPVEAGLPVGVGTSNSANWLILTSAVTAGGSRNVRGDIVGTIPPGIRLRLDISPYTGTGAGFTASTGYVTGNVYLSNVSTDFISNIKGAYTGTGYGTNGFNLKYSVEILEYANIRSGNTSLTVRYTLADN